MDNIIVVTLVIQLQLTSWKISQLLHWWYNFSWPDGKYHSCCTGGTTSADLMENITVVALVVQLQLTWWTISKLLHWWYNFSWPDGQYHSCCTGGTTSADLMDNIIFLALLITFQLNQTPLYHKDSCAVTKYVIPFMSNQAFLSFTSKRWKLDGWPV